MKKRLLVAIGWFNWLDCFMARTSTPANIESGLLPARSRGRPPLQHADVTARVEKIVSVAARLFFRDGFNETTLDAIGKEAGISKRYIYEHVGDKVAVFTAACDKLRIRGQYFRFQIPVQGKAARQVLLEMANHLAEHALRKDMVAMQRIIIVESVRIPQLIKDLVELGHTELMASIADIFDAMTEEGIIPPVNSAFLSNLFYDIVVGARGFRAALGHRPEPYWNGESELRVDFFMRGFLF